MGAGATWPSCGMLRGTAGAATRPWWPGAVAGVAQGALAAQQGRGWPGSVGGSWAGAEPASLHIRSRAPLVAFILVRVISGSRESLPHSLVLVLPGGQGAAVMPLPEMVTAVQDQAAQSWHRSPPWGVGYLMLLCCLHCPCGCCSVACVKRDGHQRWPGMICAQHGAGLCFPTGKHSKAPRTLQSWR